MNNNQLSESQNEFIGNDDQYSVFYQNNGSRNFRNNFNRRPYRSYNNVCGYSENQSTRGSNSYSNQVPRMFSNNGIQRARASNRKLNPRDANGSISRCSVCESKFHWARNCPDAEEM